MHHVDRSVSKQAVNSLSSTMTDATERPLEQHVRITDWQFQTPPLCGAADL